MRRNTTVLCGFGSKILVNYECQGRTTVNQMLESPRFNDVAKNCEAPLSGDKRCRKCLNAGILYLRNLLGAVDNVTLSTCRDATFAAIASRVDYLSTIDIASCPSCMFRKFSYKETKKATNDFSTVIGQGGFGIVYKAEFRDGLVAAVKRMTKVSEQADVDFCRELELLARLHHRHLVALRGFCYLDPEYVITQELTEKSDIYSYGVVLLELVTGRRAIQDNKNLVEWAQAFLTPESRITELVDSYLCDAFDFDQLQTVLAIVRWCTQREGRTRPSIKQVLRLLYESADPLHSGFVEAVEDQECREDGSRGRKSRGKNVYLSGDGRGLASSSSTTRSYCSRSFLLEMGSPQSPHTNIPSI
ncbi:probable receptor-like protein kinase at1g49730 [Phtheirospermum japonicum]|uniref:Probable receptor-like protein kinase at1g49730 n=1 Tax=Phtheirospermum japonicum TaxID=374723 RepID=A0A830BEH9_9LAMI|nr:probable receptor-like protein kinase at1g49730 [Phtheirospermum japonicum]